MNLRSHAVVLAAALVLAPLGARAADLVVWWEKGFYPQEDEAVHEIVAAFEQETGKQVELDLYPQDELPGKIVAALEAGRPPDFTFGVLLQDYLGQWAGEDRLADLSDAMGAFSNLFDPDALAGVTWRNAQTGQKALYGLPFGREMNHVHVWTSLLKQAGFTVADIPREWEAFWSFWCDQVQPAVRKALGRDDIWGVALPMSVPDNDTDLEFFQFVAANDASYVTRDGRLVIDDPEIRRQLVKAIASYTAIYRKGCTPPDSVTWNGYGNNREVPGPGGRHDRQCVALDPERAEARAARGLLQEHRDHRVATRPAWRALSDRRHRRVRRGLQGRQQRRPRQGVRPVPGRRGLARPLSRLFGGTLPAGDVEAARAAVLARPGRPAPDGIGDADELAAAGARIRLRRDLRQLAAPAGQPGARLGARRSTASPPKASPPSRRSTRRSPGSSRSLAE